MIKSDFSVGSVSQMPYRQSGGARRLRSVPLARRVGGLGDGLRRTDFDAEQLPERRVHAPVSGLPLLPAAQGAMDEGGCSGLRKPGRLTGGTDFLRRWVPRPATGPAAVWMFRHRVRTSGIRRPPGFHHRRGGRRFRRSSRRGRFRSRRCRRGTPRRWRTVRWCWRRCGFG